MALKHAPRIVTDGLVLALDAANPKSYPGSGTTWKDLSGNGNNGTLTNGPTFDSGNGGGISLDGTNDYISTSYGGNINPYNNPLSFSVWIKLNNVISNQIFISTGQTRGNSDNNQRLYIAVYNQKWDWGIRSSAWDRGNTINANTNWNYILIVIDSTNARFYLNGTQIYTKSVNSTYVLNDNFWFGGHDGNISYPTDCRLSNIKIYNRALSAEEVLQNYNATKSRFYDI